MQATLETSTDPLIAEATAVRRFIDVTGVFSPRLEVVATLYYKQSIHTPRGNPFKQLEPDLSVNTHALDTTWFLEWDSFLDSPGQLAQTLKSGASRAFGPNGRWTATAHYAIGINDYARLTQFRYNAGLDLTWYLQEPR